MGDVGNAVDADKAVRAVRRLPTLLWAGDVGAAAAGAGLLVWMFWGDPDQRFLILMGCLALACAALVLLAWQRRANGPLQPSEVTRAILDGSGDRSSNGTDPSLSSHSPGSDDSDHDPLNPHPPRTCLPHAIPTSPRAHIRSALVQLAMGGWFVGFFFLVIGSPTPPPQVAEIRRAGGIVADVPVTDHFVLEHHKARAKSGGRVPSRDSWTLDLSVTVKDDTGEDVLLSVVTRLSEIPYFGGSVKVIYAPGATELGAYVGADSRPFSLSGSAHFIGYESDLHRILEGRTLSSAQLWLCAILWGLLVLPPVVYRLTRRVTTISTLPGRTRALYGTYQAERVRAADSSVMFQPASPGARNLGPSLDGRQVWVCWDPNRLRKHFKSGSGRSDKDKARRGPEAMEAPAVLILDDGWALHGTVRFPRLPTRQGPAPQDPTRMGVPSDSPRAPVDTTRTVRPWLAWRMWPLTIDRTSLVSYALTLISSGLLFTGVVTGFPRLLLGLFGACCLMVAASSHYPEPGDPT